MLSQLLQFIERTATVAVAAQRWVAFWGPVAEVPALMAPFLALASVIALALLTGIAAGAVAVLLVVLVALYVLLTEVLGVSIEVANEQ
ncbi:MAG: hypothetical protein ACHQ9S_20875 [Candidatus Binatia bacterium]